MKSRKMVHLITGILIGIMTLMIAYKLIFLRYDVSRLIPSKSYAVTVSMKLNGYGDDLVVQTYLPESDASQQITEGHNSSGDLEFQMFSDGRSMRGEWSGYNVEGYKELEYFFRASVQSREYSLDEELLIPESYPGELKSWLESSDVIQSESSEIRKLAASLRDPEGRLEKTVHNLYNHVLELDNRPFKGTTDALTTLRLGAASCNGKSRLFVALARQLNIPSRLVGGLILKNGSKRTTHQWVEFYANGYWVPLDTLNAHYLSLPDNYLVLYRGDEVMFRYTPNIGFSYRYDIRKQVVPNSSMEQYLGVWNLNLYSFLHSFKRVNISLNLLKMILMIPLGVLVVVLSRNIIGINTFGTFLPALMAVSIRETGLAAGLIAFAFTLTLVTLIRYPLQKLGILHTPKLAIMMIGVVFSIFTLTILSDLTEIGVISRLGAASLFPVAILTITSERFAITIEEEGLAETLKLLVQTLAVMSACYFMMNSLALQTLVLSFPEILLGVTALNLWMGSWIGIRVVELFRFRELVSLVAGPAAEDAIESSAGTATKGDSNAGTRKED